MIVFFILCIAFALLSMFWGFIYESNEEKSGSWILGTLCTLFIVAAFACGKELWGEKPIKPIDVYRGNTTLEITYRDSVAIDTVVVWK